jgi:hypothetical protein
MRSSLVKTPFQHTVGIHTLMLRCTCTCSLMSEVVLKLGLDIVIRDPGFEHVRRTGRAAGKSVECGGMPNRKTKVLSKERTFCQSSCDEPGRQAETKEVLLPPRYSILTVNAVDHVADEGQTPEPFTESRSNCNCVRNLIKSVPVSRAGRAASGVAKLLTVDLGINSH